MKQPNNLGKYIILGLSMAILSSCSPIFNSIYGFKNLKPLNEEEIIAQSKKFNIPLENTFLLDSTYTLLLKSFDSTSFEQTIKNHYQPLQIIYFNDSLQMVSFYANCYAGGFPNLNWNRTNGFSTFPPKTLAPTDTLFKAQDLIQYISRVGSTQKLNLNGEYDFVILVYWNRFLGRQSKRMINEVHKNLQLSQGKKLKLIYINNDNFFSRQAF
jgi:hypothetical protein